MLGIDYEKADLDTRSIFAFNRHTAYDGMLYLKEKYQLSGIVILSTCNRTEIYISVNQYISNLLEMVCALKDVSPEKYRHLVVQREGKEAIHHLFQLACGMKSKIFGEDQIITQVKKASFEAREAQTIDSNLEKIFQGAITVAKKVKANVHLTAIKTSVIEEMKRALKEDGVVFEKSNCLVIGNGEIGRLAATTMVDAGAKVTVTVRNYKTKEVTIPQGCHVVDYAKRYEQIADYDVIISATTSPHHTLKYEECHHLLQDGKRRYLVDLAVPRDISSQFREEVNFSCYDIDSLGGTSQSIKDNKAMEIAMTIIKEQEEKLFEKKGMENYLSTIQDIGKNSADICYKRIKKEVNKFVQNQEQENVEKLIRQGTKKTVCSVLFEMKKTLPLEYFEPCLEVMKQIIEKQNF